MRLPPRGRRVAARRAVPARVLATLLLTLALDGCHGEPGLDPQQPRVAVTPNPMVLLVERPQVFTVTLRKDAALLSVEAWLMNGGGSGIEVRSDQTIWAFSPARDTVAVGVTTVNGPGDTVAYVPVTGRGLRRPVEFPAYGDTIRLWFEATGAARPVGYADPSVEDTVPTPQDVRWSVADAALVRVEAVAADSTHVRGVRLTPLRAGRTTLTVQATANPDFRLQRVVAVGTCGRLDRLGRCLQVLGAP